MPDSEVHYMVYESTTPVLEGNPNIDKLILFSEKERKSRYALYQFLMQIRKEKYDVLIDSYSKLESWLTTFFSGAKRRISYRKRGRNFLYTDIVNTYGSPLSNLGLIIERRLSLLDPLNLNVAIDPVPTLHVTREEQAKAQALLEEHKVDRSKKTIMISILGSSANKTYPLNYMSKLIDYIVEQEDINVLFNYIPNQLTQAQEIYDGCKPSTQKAIFFDLLGKSLRDYIALMNECAMIIGNDGGAPKAHLAPGKDITHKRRRHHQEHDHNAKHPKQLPWCLVRTVVEAAENMDVDHDEEERCTIRMGIAQQPAIIDVAHDVLDARKGIVDMRRVVHGEHDAGHNLQYQHDAGQ